MNYDKDKDIVNSKEDKKSSIGIRYMDKIIYTILLDENNSIRDVINNSNNNIDDSSIKVLYNLY